jgi:hypothetical protein
VARLGHGIVLRGHHLNGTSREVRIGNPRYEVSNVLAAGGANSAAQMELLIPVARAADFPVGVYEANARLIRPSESIARESNRLAFTLAPDITNLPQNVLLDGDGDALVTIDFTPELRAGQRATLLVGQREVVPQSFTAPVSSLDFLIENAEAGVHLVRLRIDGIDSPIVDYASTPPVFLNQRLTIA